MPLQVVWSEDVPTAAHNVRIYLTAIVVAFAAVLFGYDSSYIGTTITQPSFESDFGLDTLSPSQKSLVSSNIISTFQAGCFFGALFGFPIMERFGRKIALLVAEVVFIIGALFQICATTQLGLIYAGRALVGLGVGTITAAAPIFLAEVSPSTIRGRLIGFYEIGYQIGAVVGFWINYGIEQHMDTHKAKAWRIPMAVQLIPAGLLLIGCLFICESPRYLLKAGKTELAIKNLSYLRMLPPDDDYLVNEVDGVKRQIERENSVLSGSGILGYMRGIYSEVSQKGVRNRMAIGFCMMMFQNMVGTNSINYYSPTIFKSIGISDVNLYTGIYGLIKAAASVVFLLFLVDTWGRRQPLIVGGIACCICMYYIGAYIKIADPTAHETLSPSSVAGGKAATAAIMLFGWFFCLGWNGLAWIICAEIYPIRIRSFCAAYTACCQWLFQFIIARTTDNMVTSMGYGMFLFFGSFSILSAVFAFFCVPETKGLRLEDIDRIFGYHDPESSQVDHEVTYSETKEKSDMV